MHILVADSTGITTTGKGRWIELKWNVKYSFIKLHILADEEHQKILVFRAIDTGGGNAGSLPDARSGPRPVGRAAGGRRYGSGYVSLDGRRPS